MVLKSVMNVIALYVFIANVPHRFHALICTPPSNNFMGSMLSISRTSGNVKHTLGRIGSQVPVTSIQVLEHILA